MRFNVNSKSTIFNPVNEVYDAIVNKDKLDKYFVSSAAASMTNGAKIKWEWKDYNAETEITVLKVEPNKSINFQWTGPNGETRVKIVLDGSDPTKTEIDIYEIDFEMDEEGVHRAMGQTQGWTDFICSLKAYLYTGINLRTGKMN